eukprot:CAMPEP_0116064972 /NCGR_PEP_ID=MMETSP0322-20121206/9441_1 /TAXON_ID=163516 /ORGANISM="Leptocylindrus danicus var. apora, Strain B651" /LENGTH=322 /DNA_ID=CAMNT_0003551109 /DNA_START=32 /DNA_END=1003 /DNA_ORIENTATION=+
MRMSWLNLSTTIVFLFCHNIIIVAAFLNSPSHIIYRNQNYGVAFPKKIPHPAAYVMAVEWSMRSRMQEDGMRLFQSNEDEDDKDGLKSVMTPAASVSVNLSNRSNERMLNDVRDVTAGVSDSDNEKEAPVMKAKVNTINERLLSEIKKSEDLQNNPKTKTGKKTKEIFSAFKSQKTEEERQKAIEEAQNLNGVNPTVALGASFVAFAGAGILWYITGYLAALFATHPITTDIYSLQRLFAVFRNAVMGLVSLASGFFGVTGMGLFLLGVRVSYGVMTGELDPTPIVRKNPLTGLPEDANSEIPNIWNFMTGKKSKDGSNPFL